VKFRESKAATAQAESASYKYGFDTQAELALEILCDTVIVERIDHSAWQQFTCHHNKLGPLVIMLSTVCESVVLSNNDPRPLYDTENFAPFSSLRLVA